MGEFNLIFSPFYWKTYVEETPQLLERCLHKIEDNVKKLPVAIPPKWECVLHSSYQSNNPDMKLDTDYLHSVYSKYVVSFLSEYRLRAGQYNIHDPWYNVFSKSHFQEFHTHLPCDFSVVHYAVFDNTQHLATTFINPSIIVSQATKAFRPNLMSKLDSNLQEHSCFMEYYTPQNIKQGDLIIFPSYLNHFVKPNSSDKKRITITFNIEII